MASEIICAACVRESEQGIQYCLSAPMGTTRWSFYHFELEGTRALDQVTHGVERGLGLLVKPLDTDPISLLPTSRNVQAGNMAVFGFVASVESEVWEAKHSVRRRWCLAEEARYRLRRKPLQRLVDLLHRPGGKTRGEQAVAQRLGFMLGEHGGEAFFPRRPHRPPHTE
jgi:hypothetical protein